MFNASSGAVVVPWPLSPRPRPDLEPAVLERVLPPGVAPRGAGAPQAGSCPLSCRVVVAVVAATSGFAVETLMAGQRSPAPVATARQLAMYLAHVGLGLSQAEVARAFHRDRTTVAHACRRIEDLRDGEAFDRQVSALEAAVHWAAQE